MQQSKAYVIKNQSRNLKATMPRVVSKANRLRLLSALRALELAAYRRFDRTKAH